MKKSPSKETSRQTYIRLLQHFSVRDATKSTDEHDAILAGELADANLLDGTANRSADGDIRGALINGMTVEGRLFLQKLEDEERDSKLSRKTVKYVPILVGYVVGLLSPIITDLIRSLLK